MCSNPAALNKWPAFGVDLNQIICIVSVSSEYSGESEQMRRLAQVFAAHLNDGTTIM